MGQQQLLLLVLGIVIVGIAILVGINAYSENSVKTNWDSLLQDALRIANDAQSWKAKPELFGGSDDATKDDEDDFVGANFLQLAYAPTLVSGTGGICYQNVNGLYKLTAATTGLTIEGQNASNQNQVTIEVTGNLEDDVELIWTGAASLRGGADSAGVGQTFSPLSGC